MVLLLGIDVGTTSVKAGVFDAQGGCRGMVRRDYTLQTSSIDQVEMDAETYWEAVCGVVRQVLAKNGISGQDIAGIGVSSQGETVIPVDESGQPLHPAIVWLDNRAHAEAQELEARLGEFVYHHTGIPNINPTWTACKIAWLASHRPDVFKTAAKFLLVQDFIVFRFTNRFVTEGSIACTTLLYDIVTHTWWQEALSAIGLNADRLPEISTPGAIAGTLTAPAAEALNLPAGLPVVLGGMDQAAGAVGCGNISAEMVSETTGGALAIQVTVERPDVDPQKLVPVYVHSVPGRYLFVPVCDTGGMALKWFRDQFNQAEIETARQTGQDAYDLMTRSAQEIAPGSDGLIMLPHLTGAFSPEYNPQARGVFFGFTLYHQKAHFTRAVLEAVAFMLRRNLALIAQAGIQAREIRSTGGGAASRLWRQIKADVCQVPVVTLKNNDTAVLGDALLAGVAIGMFSSPEEGVKAMVSTDEKLAPDPANIGVYETAYQNYCQLYDALDPVFRHQFSAKKAE